MKLAVVFALEPPPPPPPKKTKGEPPKGRPTRTRVAKLRRKIHAWAPPKGLGTLCGRRPDLRPPKSVGLALREAPKMKASWVPELVNCGHCLEVLARDPGMRARIHKARQLPIFGD